MCGELAFVQDGEVGRLELYLNDVSDCNCIVISKSYLDMQAECFFSTSFPLNEDNCTETSQGQQRRHRSPMSGAQQHAL